VTLALANVEGSKRATRVDEINAAVEPFLGAFKFALKRPGDNSNYVSEPDDVVQDKSLVAKVNSISWTNFDGLFHHQDIFLKSLQIPEQGRHYQLMKKMLQTLEKISPRLRQLHPLGDLEIEELERNIGDFKVYFTELLNADDATPYIHILVKHVVKIIKGLPNRFVPVALTAQTPQQLLMLLFIM
jgi:hypothetical protein